MQDNNKALLVMDMQMGILGRLPESTTLLSNVNKAIEKARKQGIVVIFIRLGFRNNIPEINSNNITFAAFKERLKNSDLNTFMQLHPSLDVKENDIVVDKKRISAFSGNDLEMILKAQNISHLVLTGIASSGIVLSTVREAADKDYQLTVVSDGCADFDTEIHNFLMDKIFPKQAEVVTIEAWL